MPGYNTRGGSKPVDEEKRDQGGRDQPEGKVSTRPLVNCSKEREWSGKLRDPPAMIRPAKWEKRLLYYGDVFSRGETQFTRRFDGRFWPRDGAWANKPRQPASANTGGLHQTKEGGGKTKCGGPQTST